MLKIIRNIMISIGPDFRSLYLGIWVFAGMMHLISLIFYLNHGHNFISAAFSMIIILIACWEIHAISNSQELTTALQPSDINTTGLDIIVSTHLVFTCMHYTGVNTHEFFNLRWCWIFALLAVLILILRVDAKPDKS